MSEAPYVPFYTSDFLAGTSGMTAATKGVYITLLCLMYEAERPLSQQWDTLARRCGCTLPAFKKSISALQDDGKIAVINGEIWSEKCEKHIAQRRERRDSAASAAKKRWEKSKENQGKVDASALRPQCQPEPEPEIKEREDKSSLKKAAKRKTRIPEDAVLSDKFREIAIGEGLSPQEAEAQFIRFKDYNLSHGRTYADWTAAWRNWLRSPNFRPLTNVHPIRKGQGYAERLDDLYREASAALASNPF